MKILIAEDDPASNAILLSFLTKWGFEVESTSDGASAWAALSAENAPKLVILDWMMPGLEGPEVLRRIRSDGRIATTYVILLTAKADREDVIRGFEAGADDYVVKPFHRDELRVRVNVGMRIVELQEKLRERVAALEEALSHVRTLSGLLPICSYCTRIREDSDYWTELETYLERVSSAEFSHGVCPACYERHMKPRLEELKRRKEAERFAESERAASPRIG